MGTALMMEGLLSACYHVCPNYTNFQFGKVTCELLQSLSFISLISEISVCYLVLTEM